MEKKEKLRYVYEDGASMEEFYNLPIVGIQIPTGSQIITSLCEDQLLTKEEAIEKEKASADQAEIIDLVDFAEIRKQKREFREHLNESSAAFLMAHDYVWVRDHAISAWNLKDGTMCELDTHAMLMLKKK